MKIHPKKFEKEDIISRVKWINDKRINSFMFFSLPATVEATENWFYNIRKNDSRIDFSFFNENSILVAMGGFTEIDRVNKNSEFYVMVNPNLHGKGIGKEVSKWMYNYAFTLLDLNKIYLYTSDDNISAYSIYEKLGFTLEGLLRKHKFKDNEFKNRRFYGLLKSEWELKEWRQILDNELF